MNPHSILSAAAARPHTLMGRAQPVKALGSITSTWFPQVVRRNALHSSKSNRGVRTKSTLSGGIACVVGSDAALQPKSIPARKEGPFNLLMRAFSTCNAGVPPGSATILCRAVTIAVGLPGVTDEDDAVSRRITVVPFHFVLGYGNSRPLWDNALAIRDDGDVLVASNFEAVGL